MSHVLLTGPIVGDVVLQDGTVVDVTPEAIPVNDMTDEQRAEVCHLIGLRYKAEGHPADPPGEEFAYEVPEEFVDYVPNPENPDTITQEG